MAWARDKKLTASIITNVGSAKAAKSRARGSMKLLGLTDSRIRPREQQRTEYGELRAEKFDERVGMEQRAAQCGIVTRMEVADKAVTPIPPKIWRVDQQREAERGEERTPVPTFFGDQQDIAER